MLRLFSRLARPLHRFEALLFIALLAAAALFVVSVTTSSASEGLPLTAILLFLWSGLLIAVGRCFDRPLPDPDAQARFWMRLKLRCQLGLLWLLAAATTGLFCFVAYLSVRAIGLQLR